MVESYGPAGGVGGPAVLPTPVGWAGGRIPLHILLSKVMLLLAGVGLATGAAWVFLCGELGLGAVLTAAAIYLAHLAGLGWWGTQTTRRISRPPTITSSPDGEGVRFAYAFWAYYWLTAVLVMTELILLATAIVFALSATVLAIVAFAVGAVIGWFLVAMARLAPGEVIISPAGVYHRALNFTHFVPWDAVLGVRARWVKAPFIVVLTAASASTRVHRYMGVLHTGEQVFIPSMAIRTSWLATDPATVYHALAFYHAHPKLRAELATNAALGRIAAGRAVEPSRTEGD